MIEGRRLEQLRAHLLVHVPPRIRYYQGMDGPNEQDLAQMHTYARSLGARGDLILFPDGQGKEAEVMEYLVDGVAILSFFPGGVHLFGLFFDAASLPPEDDRSDLYALISCFDA